MQPATPALPVVINLSVPNFVEQLPSNIDCLIHLAQSVKYHEFPEGVHDMTRVNINATVELLEWARLSGVKHFVFTSTANVYDETSEVLTEAHPTDPKSFYGASKLCAEHLLRQYQKFFQVCILRCFTVYGPAQRGMLIPNIIERIKLGKPITLAEGAGIYLTPVYVEDVVQIINRLLTTPICQNMRLMNVCGDQVTNLSEIVRLMEKLLDKPAISQITNEKAMHFVGNNQQLKNYLGPYEFVDIQTGLEYVVSKMYDREST